MLNNLTLNRYGLLGFALVIIMLVVRMLMVQVPGDEASNAFLYRLFAAILDVYVLASILPYIAISLFTSRQLEQQGYTRRRISYRERLFHQNTYIGVQISFVLLIIGLFLGLQQFLAQVIYYIVAMIIGFIAPRLLFGTKDVSDTEHS